MSVLINGLTMPKNGESITITICDDGIAFEEWKEPGSVFKAIPVPPHYDLIDHNALKIAVMDCDAETRVDFLKHAMDCINKAPVVIPSDMPTYGAEEGEK